MVWGRDHVCLMRWQGMHVDFHTLPDLKKASRNYVWKFPGRGGGLLPGIQYKEAKNLIRDMSSLLMEMLYRDWLINIWIRQHFLQTMPLLICVPKKLSYRGNAYKHFDFVITSNGNAYKQFEFVLRGLAYIVFLFRRLYSNGLIRICGSPHPPPRIRRL